MAKKKSAGVLPKLANAELDLLTHMEHGYQLETDSMGRNPVLRHLKDGEVIRPVSVNRNTIKLLENRKLIQPAKSTAPLTILWRVTKKR